MAPFDAAAQSNGTKGAHQRQKSSRVVPVIPRQLARRKSTVQPPSAGEKKTDDHPLISTPDQSEASPVLTPTIDEASDKSQDDVGSRTPDTSAGATGSVVGLSKETPAEAVNGTSKVDAPSLSNDSADSNKPKLLSPSSTSAEAPVRPDINGMVFGGRPDSSGSSPVNPPSTGSAPLHPQAAPFVNGTPSMSPVGRQRVNSGRFQPHPRHRPSYEGLSNGTHNHQPWMQHTMSRSHPFNAPEFHPANGIPYYPDAPRFQQSHGQYDTPDVHRSQAYNNFAPGFYGPQQNGHRNDYPYSGPEPSGHSNEEYAFKQSQTKYFSTLLGHAEFSDCQVEMVDEDAILQTMSAHKVILAQSSGLRALFQTGQNSLRLPRQFFFRNSDACVDAMRALYTGSLVAESTIMRQADHAAQDVSDQLMRYALSYAAAGCSMQVEPIASRGMQLAEKLLCVDNLATALAFALDGGLDRSWTTDSTSKNPTYGPYATTFLRCLLRFITYHCSADFTFFTPPTAVDDEQSTSQDRVAPKHAPKASISNPRLKGIRFGEALSEPAPSEHQKALSSALLALPRPVLETLRKGLRPELIDAVLKHQEQQLG